MGRPAKGDQLLEVDAGPCRIGEKDFQGLQLVQGKLLWGKNKHLLHYLGRCREEKRTKEVAQLQGGLHAVERINFLAGKDLKQQQSN